MWRGAPPAGPAGVLYQLNGRALLMFKGRGELGVSERSYNSPPPNPPLLIRFHF